MARLVLFDIDGTILRSEGAGIAAMVAAGRSLFGERLTAEGVPIAGRLDPLIIRDMLAALGLQDTPDRVAAFRAAYARTLAARLGLSPGADGPPAHVRVMPGVRELIAALAADRPQGLGLLTGNFEETGRMKIRAAGIDASLFRHNAWGDDSPSDPPTRNDLPLAAARRYRDATGDAVAWRDVIIIGDTPHDVACARAHGCRSLAVATGAFSVADLQSAGADLAVQTLADTDRLLTWMA